MEPRPSFAGMSWRDRTAAGSEGRPPWIAVMLALAGACTTTPAVPRASPPGPPDAGDAEDVQAATTAAPEADAGVEESAVPPRPFASRLEPGPGATVAGAPADERAGDSERLIAASLERRFRDDERYPNPTVAAGSTALGGLVAARVYDASDLAADPVPTTCWLLTWRSTREHSLDAIRESLAELEFTVDSENRALVAASLYFECGHCRPLWNGASEVGAEGPVAATAAERVGPARITRDGDGYRVTVDAFCYSDRTWGRSGPTCATLRRHLFRVGPGEYEVEEEDLWDCETDAAPVP